MTEFKILCIFFSHLRACPCWSFDNEFNLRSIFFKIFIFIRYIKTIIWISFASWTHISSKDFSFFFLNLNPRVFWKLSKLFSWQILKHLIPFDIKLISLLYQSDVWDWFIVRNRRIFIIWIKIHIDFDEFL